MCVVLVSFLTYLIMFEWKAYDQSDLCWIWAVMYLLL